MKEIWKPIKGYENFYEVSSLGRIKSLRKGIILKSNVSRECYPSVALSVNGVVFRKHIHRFVAETFIPNPQNKPCVDHINTIRTDNRVENLRWVTVTENINNPITLGKHIGSKRSEKTKEKMRKAQKTMKRVVCIDNGKEYMSLAEAQRKTGIVWNNIWKVCNGERKKAGGFLWKYI